MDELVMAPHVRCEIIFTPLALADCGPMAGNPQLLRSAEFENRLPADQQISFCILTKLQAHPVNIFEPGFSDHEEVVSGNNLIATVNLPSPSLV